MQTTARSGVLCAVLALLLPGCVSVERYRLEIDERSRTPVRFDSSQAAQIFHAKLHTNAERDDTYRSHKALILFYLVGRSTDTFHETAFHNAQIRRTDVDGDGVITKREAQDYPLRTKESSP